MWPINDISDHYHYEDCCRLNILADDNCVVLYHNASCNIRNSFSCHTVCWLIMYQEIARNYYACVLCRWWWWCVWSTWCATKGVVTHAFVGASTTCVCTWTWKARPWTSDTSGTMNCVATASANTIRRLRGCWWHFTLTSSPPTTLAFAPSIASSTNVSTAASSALTLTFPRCCPASSGLEKLPPAKTLVLPGSLIHVSNSTRPSWCSSIKQRTCHCRTSADIAHYKASADNSVFM